MEVDLYSIFVSIASYADKHLEYTIQNAIKQANDPSKIVFGVVNQTIQPLSDRLNLSQYPVRLIQISPKESYGASWARSITQTLYDNEPFFFYK